MLLRRQIVLRGMLGLLVIGTPIASIGETLAPAHDRVILTVTGAIANTNAPDRADFDLTNFEHLGLSKLSTWTPWTDGKIEFEGILARRLMAAVGTEGTEVNAMALNEYERAIPTADFYSYDVLLALRMDGRPMRVRGEGPIWIIYPWSDHPELDDFSTREKSVWQLNALHVR